MKKMYLHLIPFPAGVPASRIVNLASDTPFRVVAGINSDLDYYIDVCSVDNPAVLVAGGLLGVAYSPAPVLYSGAVTFANIRTVQAILVATEYSHQPVIIISSGDPARTPLIPGGGYNG